MGRDPAKQATPDLFSTETVRDASPSPKDQLVATPAADKSSALHVLPKNLRHAVEHLSDNELDVLFEVAFDEARRRGRLPWSIGTDSTQSSRGPSKLVTKRSSATDKSKRQQLEIAEVTLTRGQVNAVRSAFKAGITLSRIARQFGISQSNVRKALASGEPTRSAR